jgi:hypothetical protein
MDNLVRMVKSKAAYNWCSLILQGYKIFIVYGCTIY